MTSCVNRTEGPDATQYSFQGPRWILNWIVYAQDRVKRSCHLYHEGRELDVSDPRDETLIREGLVALIDEVRTNLLHWVAEGDVKAKALYTPQNQPYYFIYAKDTLGLSLN